MIRAAVIGSVMTVVILLLRRTLGKRLPRWCFRLLWVFAAVRFVVPFSFSVEIEVPSDTLPHEEQRQAIMLDTSETVKYAEITEQKRQSVDLKPIFRTVHIIGTALCGGFMSFAYIRMRRLAFDGKPLPKQAAARWDDVTILCGDGFDSPFSCGVIKPVVFIPSHMQKLEPKQLEAVVAHEKQHIRSGDQLVKWLLLAAACLHWYDPFVWVMLRYASRDIELACDEGVLRRLGEKTDYALALIAAEEIRHTAAVCSFGAPVLNERIEFVMKSKKTTICGFTAAGVVLAMMTVFFISVDAVETKEKEETRIDSPEAQTVLEDYVEPDAVGGYYLYDTTDTEQVPDHTEPDVVYEVDGDTYEVTTVEFLDYELVPTDSVELICPLNEHGGITGEYGKHTNPVGIETFNTGVNVAAIEDAPVYAAADGKVTMAGYDSTRGNTITVDHGNGYVTYYNHCNELTVEIDDTVEAGEQIATVGATGCVTGPNLGFSVLVDGAYVDPAPLFE